MRITRPEIEVELIALDGFGLRVRGNGWLTERLTSTREESSAAGIGEEAVVADAHEALR